MMETDFFQEFFGLKEIEEEPEEDISTEDIMLAEMEELLAEMATEHGDTEKYKNLVQNFETLCEGYNEFKRGQAETLKVDAEIERTRHDRWLRILDTAVKIVGISFSVGLTLFYFGVEQERPTPLRFINKCQDLLTRTR